MLVEKTAVSPEEITDLSVLELPDRKMLGLIDLVLLNGVKITVPIRINDVNVLNNICAQLIAVGAVLACKGRAS